MKDLVFQTASGVPGDPLEVVVPLLEHQADGTIQMRGTAFFVHPSGIFLTAAHLVSDFGKSSAILMVPQILPAIHKYLRRFVVQAFCHEKTDVAVGVAVPLPKDDTSDVPLTRAMALTATLPQVGDPVHYYGYPNSTVETSANAAEFESNILAHWSLGLVEAKFLQGRDDVMQPGCCIQSSLNTDGGASGGPVMDARGRVFAVISSGLGKGLTFIAPIAEILDFPSIGAPDLERGGAAGTLRDFLALEP